MGDQVTGVLGLFASAIEFWLLVCLTFTTTGISRSMLDGLLYSQVTQATLLKKTIASLFQVITDKTLAAVLMVLLLMTSTKCPTHTPETTRLNRTLDDLTPPPTLTTVAVKMPLFLILLTKNAVSYLMIPTLSTTINTTLTVP